MIENLKILAQAIGFFVVVCLLGVIFHAIIFAIEHFFGTATAIVMVIVGTITLIMWVLKDIQKLK